MKKKAKDEIRVLVFKHKKTLLKALKFAFFVLLWYFLKDKTGDDLIKHIVLVFLLVDLTK